MSEVLSMRRCAALTLATAFMLQITPSDARGEDASACDIERGEVVYNSKCLSCHPIEPGAEHLAGPNMYGVMGIKAGTIEGFKASKAIRESGITWTAEQMDAFLANPLGYVPRNTMAVSGMKRKEDRDAVICYMEQH